MKYLAQSAVVTVSCLVWTSLTFAQDAVLYDFTASWCGPCQQMNPIVHKLSREGFPVQQVDIDKNPELAKKYSVTSIPAFVMVVNGKETSRFVGRTTEGHLRQMLSAARQSKSNTPDTRLVSNSNSGNNNQGRSGYSQPNLGQPAPFPSFNSAPAATANATASAGNGNTPTDFRIRNLAGQPAGGNGSPNTASQNNVSQNTLAHNNLSNNAAEQNGTVIRAQFDENANVTKPAPHIDSEAANVRIRIRDDQGINYGSGTIIESRPGKTYVLTCGHIFRNLKADSKVDIDIFTDDRYETFVGKVEKYDLDADVGLVSLPTDGALPVARLARDNGSLKQDMNVISVGCSGGQPPTVEKLKVTALNRYTGPDNIECTGVPVQGRSGGGLFNEDNEVVGVCIAADPKEQRGLYAGLKPVLEMLESCGLNHLIRSATPAANVVADNAPFGGNAADSAAPAANSNSGPFAEWPAPSADSPVDSNVAAASTQPGMPSGTAAGQPATGTNLQALQAAHGAKLTILIESPDMPGHTQVVIIPEATARLIADLTGQVQPTQTVAAQRSLSPAEVQNQQDQFVNGMPRNLREEDRSLTLPTDFSAAQPYRRLRK